jgi:hypothetical protein
MNCRPESTIPIRAPQVKDMQQLKHSYSTVWNESRGVTESHKDWIEKGLGVVVSDTVIVETDIKFQNAAVRHLTGYQDLRAIRHLPIVRLIPRIHSVEMPPAYVPILDVLNEDQADQNQARKAYKLECVDGPVLLNVRAMTFPFVAFSVPCHRGPDMSA